MTYTVKPGDTLSKIATRQGITLKQLLDANPQYKVNPNKLKVGDVLNLDTEAGNAQTQPLPSIVSTAAAVAVGALGAATAALLGTLSAKYETGGRGPGV